MHDCLDRFDTARCRARIAGMRDDELADYIVRIKGRLVQSHEDSYFLEESLLTQLGEACEEGRRRQMPMRSDPVRDRRSGLGSESERAPA